jgi:hypothetical protein
MLGFFLGVKDGFELEGVKVHKNPQFKKMKKRSNFTWHVLTHGYHEKLVGAPRFARRLG